MKIKAGIIGCGGIANNKHLPAIRKVDRMEMVAFCDIIRERAEKAAAEYGAPGARVYTDYKELLAEELDVVYVCTPNRSHSFITVDALHSGKHVMCEKPMAINYTEGKKMLDAARETGRLLTIAYQNRYRPDSQFLKAECEEGRLGEVYYAKAKALRRRAVPTWGVFLNAEEQGGGPLVDIGTHALDLTLWTMDNYKPKYAVGSVYHKLNGDTDQGNAFGNWDPEAFTVEDSAFGFVVMENGATVVPESSWALNTLDVERGKDCPVRNKGRRGYGGRPAHQRRAARSSMWKSRSWTPDLWRSLTVRSLDAADLEQMVFAERGARQGRADCEARTGAHGHSYSGRDLRIGPYRPACVFLSKEEQK